jgi:hypothetical protein
MHHEQIGLERNQATCHRGMLPDRNGHPPVQNLQLFSRTQDWTLTNLLEPYCSPPILGRDRTNTPRETDEVRGRCHTRLCVMSHQKRRTPSGSGKGQVWSKNLAAIYNLISNSLVKPMSSSLAHERTIFPRFTQSCTCRSQSPAAQCSGAAR